MPHTEAHAPLSEGRQGNAWEDQWRRILRWYGRVRQSRDEIRAEPIGTEGFRDEVFALFQAVWHLKDWLRNDPALDPTVGASVEDWITGNGTRLKVAADVANGSKHMTLTQARAGGSAQTRNDVSILVGSGVSHVFYVHDAINDTDVEVLALVDECLGEWVAFLTLNRLKQPGH